MTRENGLGLLLVLLLPVVGASRPGTVVRLNKEVLSYAAEAGRAPLQRALQVTVPNFLDRSGEALQPTRIQILNVHLPHLHLKLIAGFGIRLSAAANFTLKIFHVPEPLHLMLPMELLVDAPVDQCSIGTPVVSISDCFSFFDEAIVLDDRNRAAPALLVPLQKHIQAVLQSKLCLRVSNVVQSLNVHLGTLIGLSRVGPESQVRYSMINAPTITRDYISLDVNAILFLLGRPIMLPEVNTSFVLPHHVGTRGAMVTVGLSQDLFDSALLLLQKAGVLNMDITGQLKSDDNILNTSVLGQLIPEVARQFPEPMALVLKVRLGAMPTVTLHTNNATLQLQPFVEVLAPASNSAFQSLFSLNVVVNLSLQLFVSGVRLRGTTSVLGNVQITMASSNVGFIDMEKVQILMDTVFERPLLDHLNALLGLGIALPHVVNLHYISPEIFVYEGYVVVSSALLYQR
ncbi:BPI fold-containing family B member 2 precursor [Sus scrofa]|uniref:BPI fold containing family B member 2 n=2 Tax=Sus scrofa TaxID=9823 RepID=A0A8D1B2F0_PIG|nr:BPI fold-containing family B member 2 precursor [Sus scrofa]ABI64141.1 long palate lung and nasal epithelium protein 2 [Sus scrofa]